MRRDTLNYIVDALALIAMLGLIATGVLVKYVLPPGSRGGHGLTLWGLDRHEFGDIHFWTAVALVVLLVLHVLLHWTWVCVTTRRLAQPAAVRAAVPGPGVRWGSGLIFLAGVVVLIAAFVWVGSANVTRDDEAGDSHETRDRARRGQQVRIEETPAETVRDHPDHPSRGADHIRGSLTLRELHEQTGVDLAWLKEELGIPADTDDDTQLGRLRQRFGFEMSTLRDLVAEYELRVLPALP